MWEGMRDVKSGTCRIPNGATVAESSKSPPSRHCAMLRPPRGVDRREEMQYIPNPYGRQGGIRSAGRDVPTACPPDSVAEDREAS